MLEINRIYQGDCLEVMKNIDDQSIDLVVTSPPYGNLRVFKGYSFDFEKVVKELYRIAKIGGVVVWVVGDSARNANETGMSFRQALYFKSVGFNLYDTMIFETNKLPSGNMKRTYQNVFDYMFVFSKGIPSCCNILMDVCGNYGNVSFVGNSGVYGWKSKGTKRYTAKFKRRGNIWYIPRSSTVCDVKHPATFPYQLAEDHIFSWSNPGMLVYDPFMGSGTTAIACLNTGRNFIGSEIAQEYCDMANERIIKTMQGMIGRRNIEGLIAVRRRY